MAFAFACPHCESTLRTGKEIPVGKKVTCPKCGDTFAMAEELIIDEEMEPAAGKARREEAEEEEEQAEEKPKKKPAGKKKKKKKKRKSHSVVIGFIIGGALMFFAAFASLIYFVAFRTTLDVAVLAFAPSGVEEVIGLDIGEMANHEKLKPNLQKIVTAFTQLDFNKMKYGSLQDSDINKITLMGGKGDDKVVAVRYNKPVDVDKLTQAMVTDKATVGDKTVYRMKEAPKSLIYFPEPDLMIFLPDRPSKDELLKRDIKKNGIPDAMMPTLKEIWNSSVFVTAPLPPLLAVGGGSNPVTKGKIPKILSLVFRPGTESTDIQFILEMASEEDAKAIVGNRKFADEDRVKAMQAMNSVNMPGDLKKVFSDMLETLTLAQSDKKAYITGRVSLDVVLRTLNNASALFNTPAPPPPSKK